MILSDEELRQKLAQAWEEGAQAGWRVSTDGYNGAVDGPRTEWEDTIGAMILVPRNPHLTDDEARALKADLAWRTLRNRGELGDDPFNEYV